MINVAAAIRILSSPVYSSVVSVLLVGAVVAGGVLYLDNGRLESAIAQRDKTIEARNTTISKLKSETLLLGTQLVEQNSAIEKISADSAARIAAANAALADAQQATRRAQDRAAVLLSQKPTGDTLEARVRDVDARFLETLK